MAAAGHHAFLNPWPPGTFGNQFGHDTREAPAMDHEFFTTVDRRDFDVGRVAYDLVRRVYRWFGFNDDQLPYIRADAEPAIDPERIREAGRRP